MFKTLARNTAYFCLKIPEGLGYVPMYDVYIYKKEKSEVKV